MHGISLSLSLVFCHPPEALQLRPPRLSQADSPPHRHTQPVQGGLNHPRRGSGAA